MTLNEKIFHISIGVLLGDCSLQKNSSRKKDQYKLKFLQGEKHKEYIVHLHQEFKEYVISPPFYDMKRKTYYFQTLFQEDFKVVADIFYTDKNKKTISSYFTENKISTIAARCLVTLAYWFMDDGGLLSYNKDYRRKGLVFNTQGFSFQEVETLSQNLNHSYNLTTWVKENKKKPIIAVSGKEYINIRNIMYPHIVKCMRYKLPEKS